MRFFILLMAASLLMTACSDKRTSTEVENEITVASVQGIAATGYAMSSADWEIISDEGIRLAQGVTDSFGNFEANMHSKTYTIGDQWLVRVMSSEDTLAALFSIDSGLIEIDTLFGLINPITDFVAKRILGPAVLNPNGGFVVPTLDSLRITGENAVAAIFGAGVEWTEFSLDRAYRPALPVAPSGYTPTPVDLLLHGLDQKAVALGITRKALMDSLFTDPNFQALLDQGFRLDIASDMVLFGIHPDSGAPVLKQWEERAGVPPEQSVDTQYKQLWEYRTLPGTGTNGVPPGPEALNAVMGASQRAMNMSIQSYYGSNRDAALTYFTVASKMIMDLVMPYAEMENVYDSLVPRLAPPEFIETLARNYSLILTSLRPEVWLSDSLAVKSLAIEVQEHCTGVPSARIPLVPFDPQGVASMVDSAWTLIQGPSFTKDPRRQDRANSINGQLPSYCKVEN